MAVSANKLELLQIADAVAREKTIDRRIVIGAMEDAIQKAAKSRYGAETDVRAEIDEENRRDPPAARCWRWSRPSRSTRRRSRSRRRGSRNPAAQIGDYISEPLPPLDYRPHRRPVGQAGDRAEGARGRARAPV